MRDRADAVDAVRNDDARRRDLFAALHRDASSSRHAKSVTVGFNARKRAYRTAAVDFVAKVQDHAVAAFPGQDRGKVEILYAIGDAGLRSGSWAGSFVKGSPVTSQEKLMARLFELGALNPTTADLVFDERWTSQNCASCGLEHASQRAPAPVWPDLYPQARFEGAWRLKWCDTPGCVVRKRYKNRDSNACLSLSLIHI